MSQGKGSAYRKGHNAEKQRSNYDEIDWSKGKKEQPTTLKDQRKDQRKAS